MIDVPVEVHKDEVETFAAPRRWCGESSEVKEVFNSFADVVVVDIPCQDYVRVPLFGFDLSEEVVYDLSVGVQSLPRDSRRDIHVNSKDWAVHSVEAALSGNYFTTFPPKAQRLHLDLSVDKYNPNTASSVSSAFVLAITAYGLQAMPLLKRLNTVVVYRAVNKPSFRYEGEAKIEFGEVFD